MFFFKDVLGLGIDKSILEGNVGVSVAILGEISKEDNHRMEPLIKAAKRLRLPKEFDLNHIEFERYHLVKEDILPPWSPTWLIPDVSAYYYYNEGSFPVPPCYTINRVYVIKEPITMSIRQWSVLTNISSEREPSGKLDCTFSILQNELDDVRFNSNEYSFRGNDGRPMTAAESKRVQNKQEKDEAEKTRRTQLRKGLKLSHGINLQSSSVLVGLSYICLLIINPR